MCALESRAVLPWLLMVAVSRVASIEIEVTTPSGSPVADAVVYALPPTGTAKAAPRTLTIEQIDREFIPQVNVVQVGTSISFPNRDPVRHHVYSFSPAKTFEIKLYPSGAAREVVFDKPGVVRLGCNIHDWMVGYVLVVDTPHFAKSTADGRARLEMKPGEYQVKVWHPNQRAEMAAQRLVLTGDASQRLSVKLEVAPRRAKYKPPLDPANYQ